MAKHNTVEVQYWPISLFDSFFNCQNFDYSRRKRDDELGIRQQELKLEHRHAQLKEQLNTRLSCSSECELSPRFVSCQIRNVTRSLSHLSNRTRQKLFRCGCRGCHSEWNARNRSQASRLTTIGYNAA